MKRLSQRMREHVALFVAALTFSLNAMAAEPTLLSFRDVLNRKPVPVAEHRIAYGKDPLQFADLWLPKGAGPYPVVVYVHGGCWLASLPGVELTHFMAAGLRDLGFAVWEIEYRRLGHAGGGYPGTFQDVADATEHLRNIAAQYSLDLNRVIATGHSAGGHLALWLAARPRIAKSSALFSANPLPIHAVVGVAAIADISHYALNGPGACGADTVDRLVSLSTRGKPNRADAFLDTSPADLLPLNVPQILIQGARDPIVPPAQGAHYAARAEAVKERVEVVTIPNAGHFELIAPWTPAWGPITEVFKRALPTVARAK